jgi:hypothetical protein
LSITAPARSFFKRRFSSPSPFSRDASDGFSPLYLAFRL